MSRRSKLYGSALPPDAVRLFTLAELPPWAKPARPHASNVSYFFGVPGAPEVSQAVFAVDAAGAVSSTSCASRRRARSRSSRATSRRSPAAC